MNFAALKWNQRIRSKPPPESVSLLVRCVIVGPVYDVAIYINPAKSGGGRWIMGNVELPEASITHRAIIQETK